MDAYANIHGDGLTGLLADRTVFGCVLDHQYRLEAHPDFYFVVRMAVDPRDGERVCLYQENVINVARFGSDTPDTLWVTNEPLYRRSLMDLFGDMAQKAAESIADKRMRNV